MAIRVAMFYHCRWAFSLCYVRIPDTRESKSMHKTLFLQAPSFDGIDGGAASRYQAKRESKSCWFPTWLAQSADLVPDSRLLDPPADELTVQQTREIARGY